MKLHTISRDKMLYEASATYENGNITVLKGSKINLNKADKYAPCEEVRKLREDPSLFENSILLHDVTFSSLSTAATFVTGRVANGMIVWKTEDNKSPRTPSMICCDKCKKTMYADSRSDKGDWCTVAINYVDGFSTLHLCKACHRKFLTEFARTMKSEEYDEQFGSWWEGEETE